MAGPSSLFDKRHTEVVTRRRDLRAELERLRTLSDKQQRGYEFERFLGDLFRVEHFRVEPNAGTARPRQVDLLATRGADTFLVETKWRKRKADIDAVDSLFTRLDAAPASVVGVLVSDAGFTKSAIERVREKSSSPIVLLSGHELDAVVSSGTRLSRLLRRKLDDLLRHRSVMLDVLERPSHRPKRRSKPDLVLPSSLRSLREGGAEAPWLTCAGGFGRFVFVSTLPDNDWHSDGGSSVRLEIPLDLHSAPDVKRSLDALHRRGWLTDHGRWSIQQATTNWHGLGVESFVQAISTWKKRYSVLPRSDIHHTEEFCYFDECDDGYFTLTGQLSADARRVAWHMSLCFELAGIPLDPGPYLDLSNELDGVEPIHFRPLDRPAVQRHWLEGSEPARLDVRGVVIERLEDETEWVVGLVVRHKLQPTSDWWPEMMRDSTTTICDLSSWHPVGKQRRTYRLRFVETAWTSEAQVIRLVADWDDPPSARRRRDHPPGITLTTSAAPDMRAQSTSTTVSPAE